MRGAINGVCSKDAGLSILRGARKERSLSFLVSATLAADFRGFRAEDTQPDRKVAIKLLTDEFTTDTALMRRFAQVARSASTCRF